MDIDVYNLQCKLKNFTRESLAKYEGIRGSHKNSTNLIYTHDDKEITWYFHIWFERSSMLVLSSADFSCKTKCTAYVIDNQGREIFPQTDKFFDLDEIFNMPEKYLENDILTIGFKIKLDELREEDVNPDDYDDDDGDFCVCNSMAKDEADSKEEKCVKFEKWFNSEIYSDFTITCSDNVDIPVHKIVLAAHSDVFDSMFSTPMIESRDQKVMIEDVDSETMLEALRFIYLQKVENMGELVTKILYVAQKYGFENLNRLCVNFMIENISVENVIEYLVLADRYCEDELLEICLKFIKTNYKQLPEGCFQDITCAELAQKVLDYSYKYALRTHIIEIDV